MTIAHEFLSKCEYSFSAKNGEEYIQGLKNLLDSAGTLHRAGITPAPYESGDVRYFFWGQSNGSYGLNSSLYRELKAAIEPGATPGN